METIHIRLRTLFLRPLLAVALGPLLFLVAFASAHMQKWDEFRRWQNAYGLNGRVQMDSMSRATQLWVTRAQQTLFTGFIPVDGGYLQPFDPVTINHGIARYGPVCLPDARILVGMGRGTTGIILLASGVGGIIVAIITLLVGIRLSRYSPLRQMYLNSTFRIVLLALGKAWLWALACAVPIGVLVWYVGFDRLGASRALTDGFLPTRAEAIATIIAWGIAYGPIARAMVAPALADLVGVDETGSPHKCLRCLYPVESIPSPRCPECGAMIPGRCANLPAIPPSSTRSAHWTVARRLFALFALLETGALVACISPQACRWLWLQPQTPWLYQMHTISSPTLFPNTEIKRYDSTLGQWWVATRQVGLVRDPTTTTPVARKIVMASVGMPSDGSAPLGRSSEVRLWKYDAPPGPKQSWEDIILYLPRTWYPRRRVTFPKDLSPRMLITGGPYCEDQPPSNDQIAITMLLKALDGGSTDSRR